MGAVRDLLASHAIDSIVTPWIKGGGNANPTLDRQRPPPIAVCWSSTSVSLDYPRLHALARRLQQDDRYLGISLDGTVAPAGLDARSLPDLNTMLATREQDALSTLWPGPTGAIHWLLRLAVGARTWWHWLVAVPVVALVVVLLEFGLNYANSVENVCKFSILREPCRYLEGSGVPTREEEQDWNRAAAGKACKPFNDYLEAHGPNAAYSADARQRLELSIPVGGVRRVSFPIFVPDFDRAPRISQADAEAEARTAAARDARAQCSGNARNFDGEASPGVFTPNGPPRCSHAGGGWVCEITGAATCRFDVANAARACPPAKH